MIEPAPSAEAENQRILQQATSPSGPGAQLHNVAAHGQPALQQTRSDAQKQQTEQAMVAAGELRPATADEMRQLDA